MPKKSYLSNKELFAEIVQCQATNRVSDKLAKMLMLMVHRIALKPNFRSYSYIDDMRCDALLQLIKINHHPNSKPDPRPNILKFDASYAERTGKQQNPFAYTTQIIMNAFRRHIKDEGKLHEFKDDMLEDSGMIPSFRRQVQNDCNRSSEPLTPKRRLPPNVGRKKKQITERQPT